MLKLRPIPYATLSVALITTIIMLLKLSSENFSAQLSANLNVYNWQVLYDQPWRILTSPFLHHDFLHFLGNLVFLLLFGIQIERSQGWATFLGVFFGAMVTGYVIWINTMHDFIIGISGGVYGLFGFSLIANRRSPWWTTLTHRPLQILFILNILFSLFAERVGWVPYSVAHINHVGGFLYGVAFGSAFLLASRRALWRGIIIAVPILLFVSQLISPWQVERRLVNSQPVLVTETANCRLESPDQENYIPAAIEFINTSGKPVATYWLDYEGVAQFQFWLRSGASRNYNSYVGHPWCIVDFDRGEALEAVVISDVEQNIVIR